MHEYGPGPFGTTTQELQDAVTRYSVTGEPPSLAGAFHVTVTRPFASTAEVITTGVGAPIERVVPAFVMGDRPIAFFAATVNV